MSTWTNERHEDARRALEEDMSQWGMEYGDAALDEIERLRSPTTITDDMVERGAEALFYTMCQESDGACWISEWDFVVLLESQCLAFIHEKGEEEREEEKKECISSDLCIALRNKMDGTEV